MLTVGYYTRKLKEELHTVASAEEIRQLGFILFDYLRGYSMVQVMLGLDEPIAPGEARFLDDAICRLKNHEPVQYIVGRAQFMGIGFEVDPRVLIPRPETEELVAWILEEYSGNECDVLDIGTGSGCIAVAIKKNWPAARVEAWDVSAGALEVAARNAVINAAEVLLRQVDVLTRAQMDSKFDVIVSNPPYVTANDKRLMAPGVIDFEPHQALFPGGEYPLLFYDAIATLAAKGLREGGRLYFEINELYGEEVCQVLKSRGLKDVVLKKDLNGRDRLVRAIWPGA